MCKKFKLIMVFLALTACSNHLKIDKNAVDAAFDETSLPFAILGVSIERNDPLFYSFGESNPDAVFEIASMTKAITSTAVMQLVEAGKINLDAPVSDYFPEINQIEILNEDLTTRPGTVPITMRHLLTLSLIHISEPTRPY